jgi:hypothetical protein
LSNHEIAGEEFHEAQRQLKDPPPIRFEAVIQPFGSANEKYYLATVRGQTFPATYVEIVQDVLLILD